MSRSEYYRCCKEQENEGKELEKAVINCFERNKANYGRIRIRKSLLRKGIDLSEYRIARILKKNGLIAKGGRPRKARQPKPTEKQYTEENLIYNKFDVTDANYLWCSDITELKCYGTKLYLCCIIDVATRRIVGWSVAKDQTQRLVQDAFRMAVGRNPIRPNQAIYHSDRGCQYTARKTKLLIEENGFRKSMSRPGTPSDNQPIESFWKTLKCEMDDIRLLKFDEAKRKIVEYIELYYNSERLHSGIGYAAPNNFFTLLSVHYS